MQQSMTAAERAHTKKRLIERYGLETTGADLFQMAKLVAHGRAVFVCRQSRWVAQWRLDYRGVSIRLVFDRQRRAILTALPPEDSAEFTQSKRRDALPDAAAPVGTGAGP